MVLTRAVRRLAWPIQFAQIALLGFTAQAGILINNDPTNIEILAGSNGQVTIGEFGSEVHTYGTNNLVFIPKSFSVSYLVDVATGVSLDFLAISTDSLATPDSIRFEWDAIGPLTPGEWNAQHGELGTFEEFFPGDSFVNIFYHNIVPNGAPHTEEGLSATVALHAITDDNDQDQENWNQIGVEAEFGLVGKAFIKTNFAAFSGGGLVSASAAAVPEASEALVFLLGMTGLMAGRRRKR